MLNINASLLDFNRCGRSEKNELTTIFYLYHLSFSGYTTLYLSLMLNKKKPIPSEVLLKKFGVIFFFHFYKNLLKENLSEHRNTLIDFSLLCI